MAAIDVIVLGILSAAILGLGVMALRRLRQATTRQNSSTHEIRSLWGLWDNWDGG